MRKRPGPARQPIRHSIPPENDPFWRAAGRGRRATDQGTGNLFEGIETPALLLDTGRLGANAARMRERAKALGVALRPHLKTAKSVEVARVAFDADSGPITVSTLREAEHFARAGFHDILYAVAVAPGKLAHVRRIQGETGARILLCVDSPAAASAVVAASGAGPDALRCLVEIDCGEHRSGVAPASPELKEIARILAAAPGVLQGVMTHAGHSYGTNDPAEIARIAEDERRAAVDSAKRIRDLGLDCPVVSVGSTPTAIHAAHLDGVTELRCGIYLFWDLAQHSRGICAIDDIAVSVLATVIGHNREAGCLVIDAGALALSKDAGANAFMPHVKFGLVCDAVSATPIQGLSVAVVHHEHGTVPVPDPALFDRLPVGSLVRVLPNHACLTCAAYDRYDLTGAEAGGQWPRVNGW